MLVIVSNKYYKIMLKQEHRHGRPLLESAGTVQSIILNIYTCLFVY